MTKLIDQILEPLTSEVNAKAVIDHCTCSGHDPRWCQHCESRTHGIHEFIEIVEPLIRARLEALLGDGGDELEPLDSLDSEDDGRLNDDGIPVTTIRLDLLCEAMHKCRARIAARRATIMQVHGFEIQCRQDQFDGMEEDRVRNRDMCYKAIDKLNKIAVLDDRGEILRIVDSVIADIAEENW